MQLDFKGHTTNIYKIIFHNKISPANLLLLIINIFFQAIYYHNHFVFVILAQLVPTLDVIFA